MYDYYIHVFGLLCICVKIKFRSKINITEIIIAYIEMYDNSPAIVLFKHLDHWHWLKKPWGSFSEQRNACTWNREYCTSAVQ